jgi:threonyl-tRNA synthetase
VHIQIFNQGLRSYRELPVAHGRDGVMPSLRAVGRAARHPAGAQLHQDDAHIFCSGDQIESETIRFCELLARVYRDLASRTIS